MPLDSQPQVEPLAHTVATLISALAGLPPNMPIVAYDEEFDDGDTLLDGWRYINEIELARDNDSHTSFCVLRCSLHAPTPPPDLSGGDHNIAVALKREAGMRLVDGR